MFIQAAFRRSPPPSLHDSDDLHPTQARWFALRVGYRKEKSVARQLDKQGITTFCPLREKPYHYRSKIGVRRIPLLGGYLFVRIVRRELTEVLQTRHVFGFVKMGRKRQCIRQEEIDLLRRLSTDDSLQWVVEEKLTLLEVGTPVELCRGPLAGVRGRYVRQKNKHTFIITFPGLDARLMNCEVSPDDVIPLHTSAQLTS